MRVDDEIAFDFDRCEEARAYVFDRIGAKVAAGEGDDHEIDMLGQLLFVLDAHMRNQGWPVPYCDEPSNREGQH